MKLCPASEENIMHLKEFTVGPIENNTFVVWNDHLEAVIIDAPAPADEVIAFVREKKLSVQYILLTHGHYDHILGLDSLKEATGAPIVISQEDAFMLQGNHSLPWKTGTDIQLPKIQKADLLVQDGDELVLGENLIRVLLAPGHTPGDTVYQIEDMLFTGDTLFAGTMGRVDLPGGDMDQLLSSLVKIKETFPATSKVCPGHGPSTTLKYEIDHNPYYNGRTEDEE